MKRIILGTLLITVFSLLYFCNSVEPPLGDKPKLLLALKDVSCTETWIELTTTNLQLPATISLKQNNQTRSTINLVKADTLLYIDTLLPNTSYKFQASSIENPVSSNEITAATLDTTSHNFTFETWTFGEHSSSVLYDVAIIDENNIWAVGEIYMNDSLGQPDSKRYNAIRWNGANWDIIRIPYNYQGTDFYHPIQSTFAFGSNDIWFCGNGVIHWEGKSFIPIAIPTNVWGPYQMNKIWGSSSNDLYVVGNEGNIAHYQNGQWSRITSGTELHINDIWGDYNSEKGEYEILCIASNQFINLGQVVLQIKGNNIITINSEGLSWSLNTMWFIQGRKYFIGGDGLYISKYLGENWTRDNSMPPYYKMGVRGNGMNDIVIVGAFGLLLHFNGITWKNFQDITYIYGSYGRVDIKGDLICCTGGLNDGSAIVSIGRR